MVTNTPPSEQTDPFRVQPTPELVFGIIGPLGIDLDNLTNILKEELDRVNYRSRLIRLSGLLRDIEGLTTKLKRKPEHERIRTHMKAGTELRSLTGIGGILARIAIADIQQKREEITGSPSKPANRVAYILRSLKHKDELQDLRDVYGDGFIAISAYSPKDEREWALTNQLAKSKPSVGKSKLRATATKLIEIDEAEEGKALGQNVGDAFPLADFFVEASDRKRLRENLRRFIELFFGNHFVTPSRDEFGMYQAAAAAFRSADLSRQVGAALATQDGEIIAVGCNDTPKAGGGLYWAGDEPDGRDFALFGHDPSEQTKREIIAEMLERLDEAGFLAEKQSKKNVGEQADDLLSGHLKGAQIANLLEFGRVLHAEMGAITEAARRGVPTMDTILYCTTFPCHLCARLIIASGIKRVVFIEPYPKSKTEDLYHDSVVVDELDLAADMVNFQAFVGVAPRIYDQLFRMEHDRKTTDGEAIHWEPSNASPKIRRFQAAYISLEINITAAIPNWLNR